MVGRIQSSNPRVVANAEAVEAHLREFRQIREISQGITALYDTQKPNPLLGVDEIGERMEHTLDFWGLYQRGYRYRRLYRLMTGSLRHFLGLIVLAYMLPGIELTMADYHDLDDYQFEEVGAKRYETIWAENDWRFDGISTA